MIQTLLTGLVQNPFRNHSGDEGEGKSSPEEIGIFTIYLLLGSLSVLFLGGIIAYLWMRYLLEDGHQSAWYLSKVDSIRIPLLLCNASLLLSSFYLHRAKKRIEMGWSKGCAKSLSITWLLGLIFLGQQFYNWYILTDIFINTNKNIYIFIFYLLTFMHAFHLGIGIFFLGFVFRNAQKGKYSSFQHSQIKYISLYWHFLTIVWIVLFLVLYFL